MNVSKHNTPESRFRAVMELHEFSVRLMEDNIRRRQPQLSEEQVTQHLNKWLRTRPGAELGDGPQPPWTRTTTPQEQV